MKIRNTLIIFIVSGFWHGANWTFIIWGALHAVYFLPLIVTNNNKNNVETIAKGKLLPSLKELSSMLLTFSLTVLAWVFFRAESITHAMSYFSKILSPSLFAVPEVAGMGGVLTTIFLIGLFILIEWLGRDADYAISPIGQRWNRPLRWVFYSLIVFSIGMFMPSVESPFIYSQF